MQWIDLNVEYGEIIFHNEWDYSLILFYLDTNHYYLVGLDSTFMYDSYPEEFEVWRSISGGSEKDLSDIVNIFNSKNVIVDKRFHTADEFIEKLEQSPLFEKKIENEEMALFSCSEACEEL
jgi:hypothetical protein